MPHDAPSAPFTALSLSLSLFLSPPLSLPLSRRECAEAAGRYSLPINGQSLRTATAPTEPPLFHQPSLSLCLHAESSFNPYGSSIPLPVCAVRKGYSLRAGPEIGNAGACGPLDPLGVWQVCLWIDFTAGSLAFLSSSPPLSSSSTALIVSVA